MYKLYPQDKDKSTLESPQVLPGPRPQTGLGSRSGRAQTPRKGAGKDQSKADTLGIPLGPNTCAVPRCKEGPTQPRSGVHSGQLWMQRGGVARSGSRSAQARVPRNGKSGKRSQSRSGRTRMPRKGVTLAEAIQLAHARFSCASFGRVSQDSSHYACQRASPTVLAVLCKGSPAVLIIEFGCQK